MTFLCGSKSDIMDLNSLFPYTKISHVKMPECSTFCHDDRGNNLFVLKTPFGKLYCMGGAKIRLVLEFYLISDFVYQCQNTTTLSKREGKPTCIF